MLDLSQPWPFGLSRSTWLRFTFIVLVILAAVVWLDPWASVGAMAWPPAVNAVFAFITDLGLSEWILVPSLILFALCAGLAFAARKAALRLALVQMAQLYAFIFIGVGLPGLFTAIVKRIIGRGRPEVLDEVGHLGLESWLNDWTFQSFPSGHATTSFAFAFVVGFLARRWFIPMLLVAIAVAVSRVAIGAHFPTDVIAGAVVGMLGAYLTRGFFADRGWLFRRTPDGRIVLRGFGAVRRFLRRRPRPQPR